MILADFSLIMIDLPTGKQTEYLLHLSHRVTACFSRSDARVLDCGRSASSLQVVSAPWFKAKLVMQVFKPTSAPCSPYLLNFRPGFIPLVIAQCGNHTPHTCRAPTGRSGRTRICRMLGKDIG